MNYNNKEQFYHSFFMDLAHRCALQSHCNNLKVGTVAIKDDQIISYGWNGTPETYDNACEDEEHATHPFVIHAEANMLDKLARSPHSGEGSVIYCTHSPCLSCAVRLAKVRVSKVYYAYDYKSRAGLDHLEKMSIPYERINF